MVVTLLPRISPLCTAYGGVKFRPKFAIRK